MTSSDRYTIEIVGENGKLALSAYESVQKLGEVNDAARGAGESTSELANQVESASEIFSNFEGPLGNVAEGLSSIVRLLSSSNAGLVGAGAALAGYTTIVGLSVAKIDELTIASRRNEALLVATGHAAGLTGDELESMAKRLALASLSSMDDIRASQSTLLSFRSVGKQVFEEVISLAQGMSVALGGDVQGRVEQLGEALELPAEGLSALEESFVFFTEAEQDMIAKLDESGLKLEAQRIILDRVKATIGNAGSSVASDTLSGGMQSLSVHWSDFLTVIGEGTGSYSIVTDFINSLGVGLAELNKQLAPASEVRLNALVAERIELQTKLNKAEENGRKFRGANAAQARINAINAEIQAIQEARKAEILAEADADESREKYLKEQDVKRKAEQKAAADAEAADKLAAAQSLSAAILENLDQQYANEKDRINLKRASDLKRIEELQLDKVEIERRGFETIQDLRDHYRDLANEYADEQFQILADRRRQEIDQELAQEERKQAELLKMQEAANRQRLSMESSLQSNLLSLGNTIAAKDKKLKMAMLAVDTFLKAKQAITAGYVAGAEAAKSLAGTGPQGPALAAAANAEMIRMGYANAALITANGIAQGVASGSSGSGYSSSGGYGGSPAVTTFSSSAQDVAVTSVASSQERRAGEPGVVIYGDFYAQGAVSAIDAESFAAVAMRNKTAIADATESALNEYGRSLVNG
jgi:hypothetical protein